MWGFSSPLYLGLLVLVPAGIYFLHIRKKRGNVIDFPLALWKGEMFRGPKTWVRFLRVLVFCCFWTGVVFLIIALSGPQWISREKVYISRGVDIMIVLDESPSMSAKDFPPENRFESAKKVINTFIGKRDHDSIGIVSFGKEAALRVPPTLDYEVLKKRIEALSIMDLGDGTAIGMGMAVALLHLEKTSAEKKTIILLTDGENNAGEISPRTAASMAASMNIRVHTIGVGSKGEVPLEFTDPNTGKHYSGTFKSGFDEKLLREIATTTGGTYFHARNPGGLALIFQAIDAMEFEEKISKMTINRIPRHRPFILIGFSLIISGFFIRRIVLQEVLW
jgi:Ca-activated chloride channel family protein